MRTIVLGFAILFAAGTVHAKEGTPLDELAASAGKNPTALIELGDLYVEAMQINDAKKVYKQALAIKPDSPEAKFGLIRIAMAKNKFKRAKKDCRKLAEKHKKASTSEVCSGWFWLNNDRSSRAVEEFEKAIKKGDVVRGKTGMGEAMRLRGDWQKAISAYKEAIDAGASYLAHLGLGLALEMKGDRKAALESLKKAVALQPASCLSHYHYGRVLGRGSEAIRELKMALAMRPDWVDAHMALGDIYEQDGDHKAAAESYRSAIKGEKGRGAAFFGLGKALHGLGDEKEALKALKKAVELIPNHIGAHLLYADIQYTSGDDNAAIEALEKARNAAPGELDVYLHSGEVFFRMGRYTSARTFLTQAITMQPNLSRAHALLGDIACERRLYDAGAQHYQSALKGDMVGVDKKEIQKKQASCKPKR